MLLISFLIKDFIPIVNISKKKNNYYKEISLKSNNQMSFLKENNF